MLKDQWVKSPFRNQNPSPDKQIRGVICRVSRNDDYDARNGYLRQFKKYDSSTVLSED